MTLRENTERPVTIVRGTSRLVGNDPHHIRAAFADVLEGRWPHGEHIPLWGGKAAERAATALAEWVGSTEGGV
ncbi:MAG: UDP-N-acetylglucosamine 2-epimerase [Acidobacteriota bacterium]